MKTTLTILGVIISGLVANAQSSVDTIFYSSGATLCNETQQFNFKFINDTLICWGNVNSVCCNNHYFIIEKTNDTIIFEKYTPEPTCDCSGSFIFFVKIPDCYLSAYRFFVKDSIFIELDSIINNDISSTTEYIDTILFATALYSGNPQNQQLNVTFENDTITFSGKIAASYNATLSNHYFITEIRNDTILIDRYDLNVNEASGLYDFSIKIPDCTLNTYNFILNNTCFPGFDTIITQSTAIQEIKPNDYGLVCYPDATNSKIIIELTEVGEYSYTLLVSDINGKILSKFNNYRTNKFEIKKAELKSGIYMYQLIRNDGELYSGKFLIEN